MSLDLVKLAKKAAIDKKAKRIVVQNLKGMSDVCDYQMICSGANMQQTKAICSAIEQAIKTQTGAKAIAQEGLEAGHWVLLDFGGFIVHIFDETLRDYYAIESLWPDAEEVSV